MSAKLFKNFKHARRCLPDVFLCIQAVDKKLKLSYLWDAFFADVCEITAYVEELYRIKLLDHELKVLRIDDTVFVTQYDNLKHHIDSFTPDSVNLINVSKSVETPSLLTIEKKTEVLMPIIKCSQEILTRLHSENGIEFVENIDYTLCNLCTLFGVLLGYPVLYWFSHQSPYSDFSCLSMLPLKVHKIFTTISLPNDYSATFLNLKNIPKHHELFSFSIPENVCQDTNCVVQNWFYLLMCKSKLNSIFQDFTLRTNIVTLPTVSM